MTTPEQSSAPEKISIDEIVHTEECYMDRMVIGVCVHDDTGKRLDAKDYVFLRKQPQ